MKKLPRILDLYCGVGGAGYGYAEAGFTVIGVDSVPQPEYPFDFICDDALDVLNHAGFVRQFAAIHASPPCQSHSTLRAAFKDHNYKEYPNLIPQTRAALRRSGLPYVIENVVGAPLEDPVCYCGTAFGLGVTVKGERYHLQRHRLFESNVPLLAPGCAHVRGGKTIGIYGVRPWGGRRRGEQRNDTFFSRTGKVALGQEALGIPWSRSWESLCEAIPPEYTFHIGAQLLQAIGERAA